ncbi:MAG TPA: GNAT family protein [Flavobacterium sp.]|jgi:RimJ/RimL family protein N-acetyltransferase
MDQISNWVIDRVEGILPQEFYALVQSNLQHIKSTFPVTLACCSDLQKTALFLLTAIEKEKAAEGYHFFIRNLETDSLIGYICVKSIDKRNMKCELAYFVDRDFEGKGITSAAIDDIIAICFSALQMNKIFICTSLTNFGSQRIAVKKGFRHEGILRQEFKNGDGILEDINYYGLLKSDYNER